MHIRCNTQIDRRNQDEELKEDEYETNLMSKTDDKILRQIFSGFAKLNEMD
jgi:hypothetical protein